MDMRIKRRNSQKLEVDKYAVKKARTVSSPTKKRSVKLLGVGSLDLDDIEEELDLYDKLKRQVKLESTAKKILEQQQNSIIQTDE